jgi:hypothetical protein
VDKLLPNDLHETEIGYFFGKHKTHTEESRARKKETLPTDIYKMKGFLLFSISFSFCVPAKKSSIKN